MWILMEVSESTQRHTRQIEADRAGAIYFAGADPEILKGGCTKFSGPESPCFRFDPFFILL